MAVSFCRRVFFKTKLNLIYTPCRTGYVVLLPETPKDQPDENPLLRTGTLPPFTGLTTEHCESAMGKLTQIFETGLWELEEKLQSTTEKVDAITEVIETLEKIGVPMENTWGVVKTLYLADQNLMPGKRYMTIHERARRVRSSKFNSLAIYKACKKALDDPKLTDEQRRVLKKFVLEGSLNGLEVEENKQEVLNDAIAKMGLKRTAFRAKHLAATLAFKQIVTDASIVRDFPEQLLKKIAQDPEQPTRGPWTFSLQPDLLPQLLEYCPDRDLRKNLYLANVRRCSNDTDKQFTTSVDLEEIRDCRRVQAQTLGFPSYFDMSMETKMAETVHNVENVLNNLLEKARPAQKREIENLEAFAQERGFEGNLELWDVPYWKRKQQRSLFQFNEEKLRDYFPLPQVLLGLFTLCEQLFDVKIEERKAAETWHRDVRFFRVRDEKSKAVLGGFYLDPYARPGKVHINQDPGWMVGLKNRSDVCGSAPLAALIFNFQEPIFGKPSLLSFREVQLLFRRFGHALQHMLTQTKYSEVSGLSNIEWDAVEICSRFVELWLWDKSTLESVTSHYETGEPLPGDVLDTLPALQRHMAGLDLCREIYLARLDLELHRSREFWLQIVRRLWPAHFIFELSKDDSHVCSFKEIFAEEWGAAYYCHLWARVVAADVFLAFVEAGLDNHQELSAIGTRFRSTFLTLGGSCHPSEVFQRFRGRGPSTLSLINMLGLNDDKDKTNTSRSPVVEPDPTPVPAT